MDSDFLTQPRQFLYFLFPFNHYSPIAQKLLLLGKSKERSLGCLPFLVFSFRFSVGESSTQFEMGEGPKSSNFDQKQEEPEHLPLVLVFSHTKKEESFRFENLNLCGQFEHFLKEFRNLWRGPERAVINSSCSLQPPISS